MHADTLAPFLARYLQLGLGLEVDARKPIVACVTRLVPQKVALALAPGWLSPLYSASAAEARWRAGHPPHQACRVPHPGAGRPVRAAGLRPCGRRLQVLAMPPALGDGSQCLTLPGHDTRCCHRVLAVHGVVLLIMAMAVRR